MVSNFERIFDEISKQAHQAPEDFDAQLLTDLAMKIVEQEDLHATRRLNINQVVENLIEQAASADRGVS